MYLSWCAPRLREFVISCRISSISSSLPSLTRSSCLLIRNTWYVHRFPVSCEMHEYRNSRGGAAKISL